MKVTIGRVNDPFEREADVVASRVTAGLPAPPITTLPPGGLAATQRKENEADDETGQKEAPAQMMPVQRAASGSAGQDPDEAPEPAMAAPTPATSADTPKPKKDEEPIEQPGRMLPLQRAATPEADVQEQAEEPAPAEATEDEESEGETDPEAEAAASREAPARGAEAPETAEAGDVQTSAASAPASRAGMTSAAAHAIQSKGPGEPMHAETRGTLESRMGVDLRDVRVHEGPSAQESAGALRARAFTHGRDIWLGRGESQRNIGLMAHETTHVLQQNAVVRRKPIDDSKKKEEEEKEEEKGTAPPSAATPVAAEGAAEKPPEKIADAIAGKPPAPEELPKGTMPVTTAPVARPAPIEAKKPLGEPAPAAEAEKKPAEKTEPEKPEAEATPAEGARAEAAPAEAAPAAGAPAGEAPTGAVPTPGEAPPAAAPKEAETPAEKPAAKEGEKAPAKEGEKPPAGEGKKEAPKEAAKEGDKAKAAGPEADPRYQGVMKRLNKSAKMTRAHEPATKKVTQARAAVEPPANDRSSRAQAGQVDVMAAAQPKKPEPATFLEMLRAKLREIAPSNMEETEKFKKEGKAGKLKESLTSEVTAQKDASARDIEGATKAEPNPESVEAKEVTPLPPEPADPKAPALKSEDVLPQPKTEEEVSVKANKDEADRVMAENDLDEEQLREANEPQFTEAVDAKTQLDAHVEQVPEEYRAEEQAQLDGAKAELGEDEQSAKAQLKLTRQKSKKEVSGKQAEAKKKEEEERKRVADTIEGIYNKTRTAVESKLSSLDSEVDTMFDAGEKAARDRFETYVDQKMADYKWDRYIDRIGGSLLWAKDKLFGMPDEVNAFYEEGRDQYIADMDVVLVRIANKVEERLKEAKDEIARGREEIRKYVAELPKNLQKAGQEAEKGVSSKFADLEQSVDAKKEELAQKLATKAKEARGKLDERIKELKAANMGLLDALLAKLREIIEILRNFKERVSALFQEGAGVIRKIIKSPIKFLKNLLAAVKLGFNQFKDNILEHLKKGILGWLFGALAGAGIEIPSEFSIKAIFGLVMQILGLTRDRIRAKVVKLIGAKNVERLEMAWEFVQVLIKEGPAGLWEKVKEFLSDLKETVISGIRDWVVTAIVKAAVVWLVSLFNPVSALLKAIKAIYDVVMFFVERIDQILEIVQAIIKATGKIVAGQIGDAANWVEKTMSRLVPVVISFLAALLGLGGISDKIKGIIQKLQDRVDKVVDKVLAKIVKGIKKVLGKGKAAVKKGYEKIKDILFPKKKFTAGEESHTIWINPKTSPPTPMISTTPTDLDEYLEIIRSKKGVKGNQAKEDRIDVVKKKLPGMKKLIDTIEKGAKNKNPRTNDDTRALATLENDIATDLQFILKDTKSSDSDKDKYKLEGLVATYATMPRMEGDRMTPDHQPQKGVLEAVGELDEFAGTKAEKIGKVSGVPAGVAINIFHVRHVAGRTYGGKGSKTKKEFLTELSTKMSGVSGKEKRQVVAIGLLKQELKEDVKAMEDVYDKTGADHYKDIKKEEREEIRTRGKAGLNRIRTQDLGALKEK